MYIDGRKLLADDTRIDKSVLSFTKNSRNDVIFRVAVELPAQSEVVIVIPMIKMMKSFENYPHDPQRGHDIIGAPLFVKEKTTTSSSEEGQVVVDMLIANNLVAFLPEPDFSMPFKVITLVCVLMGYLFM